VPGTPGARLAPSDVQAHAGAPLYEDGVLRTLFLDFPSADWEDELAAFHNTDVELPATLRADGRTYAEVGVGFRGASSFGMVPAGSKRSLNVSLDYADEDQALEGYRSLNLLNANNDPTFVRTALYSHIARQYTPAPAVNFVRVVINGESWGVYPSAQQFNKDFLRDFYGTTEGARWKVPGSPGGRAGMEYLGDDVDAYRRLYEIKTKDDPERWADLVQLFRILNETPPERLEAALAPLLDVDGALRFLALDVALVNSDGYWTRASDYNLYQDEQGRFHVIPHDMNEAMGIGGGPGGGGARLDPLTGLNDPTKPLRSKLLAVPALRERYLAYVRDIAERWMDWETAGPLVERWQALIREDVARDTRKLYATEAFDSGVAELRGWLADRREYLLAYGR
jgi:spore coat protein CotH